MTMVPAFNWQPGQPPPVIEEHSLAKEDVLRSYLSAYIYTLNRDPRKDVFRLDLVDGFAGGGLYLHHGRQIAGSPLLMLEECQKAERRLNKDRRKPLQFDIKYHFVEKNVVHAQYLRKVLDERSYLGRDCISIYGQSFGDVVEQIISDIAGRQRSGRSIFLLDQCGYTDADIHMVRRIGERLRNAEVILTVSIDAMLNTVNCRLALSGVLDHFGNRTAATIADLNGIVLEARDHRELKIVGPDGRAHSRNLKIVRPNDRLVSPAQRTFTFRKG